MNLKIVHFLEKLNCAFNLSAAVRGWLQKKLRITTANHRLFIKNAISL